MDLFQASFPTFKEMPKGKLDIILYSKGDYYFLWKI